MFEQMTNLDQVKRIIKDEALVFVYIGQDNCSVCHSLKPQVEKILKHYPEMLSLELDALETPAVAEAFQVLTVPVLLLFVEGREYLRKARIVNTGELKQELDKIVAGLRAMWEVSE